jgi:hypothetical protein
MMRRIQTVLVFLLLSCVYAAPAYCNSVWNDFLQTPKKQEFINLKTTLSGISQQCSVDTLPTEKQIAQLLNLVRNGNQSALYALWLIYGCLDVGDSEDANRSVGIFLEKHPRAFLTFIQENSVSGKVFHYMVVMLPLTLVDNVDGRSSIINKRIAALRA